MARSEPESSLRCELQARYACISLELKVVNHGLRTFCDLKGNVNLWLTINDVSIDFDVFIAMVLVKSCNALHALAQQFVAKSSSREHEPVWLNHNMLNKVIGFEMLVAAKSNSLDLVARSSVNLVNQLDIGRLIPEVCGYPRVEVAFALKEIDQVSPAFFHKIRINSTLRKYGDRFFICLCRRKGSQESFAPVTRTLTMGPACTSMIMSA